VDALTARLRSVPLRVKLVAAVLALVSAALVLIAVASTLALRVYLRDQIDAELQEYTRAAASAVSQAEVRYELNQSPEEVHFGGPTDYLLGLTRVPGRPDAIRYDRRLDRNDLPALLSGAALDDRLGKGPFTLTSPNHRHWRVAVIQFRDGSVLHVGKNMAAVDYAVDTLIWVDMLVGAAVLIALAGIGAAIVRSSLRPLRDIERTATVIAAGDLSRRVPDPEPDDPDPKTELGRLSRTFNAMLAQIEAAFVARAESESAARTAQAVAQEAAAAARASEARALRSEDRMRQFVADASHELRTPLTTIRGFAELYRQGAVPSAEDAARLVRRIEDEAARMGLLVEDLLLLARLDRERPLVLAPVELPVLAADAVQAARVTAPDRTIELDVQAEPQVLVVQGDDARLRQVIGNLVTNALVHTPAQAGVTVRLRAHEPNQAVVEVADTGPGLTPEQRERVFERFYRADAARTRRANTVTGTGLGLAIVSAIVAAHDGRVEVDSEPGQGATFRVLLPLAPVPADAA
jgi:two-component system OmpR family sensor kinase